jgi:hypothetical protein
MLKRMLILSALFAHFVSVCAIGQNTCAGTAKTKLYCLMPTAFHTPAAAFNFFNTAFATELSQLPLATPASGFIFSSDPSTGLPTLSSTSFGPIMTERGETIGRHKLFLAFTYQQFRFHSIDGNDLENVPIVFYFPSVNNPSVVTQTNNRINSTVNQYVGYATFGLTKRIDVSIAVPFSRISLGVSSSGTEYSTTTPQQQSFQEYIPGSASGFGDVVLAAKGTAWSGEHMLLALGAELRLPSGDALNFLGSGAVGIKPYVALSGKGRVSPHVNLGYQWNGNSVLARDLLGNEQQLPGYFLYYLGADIGASKRLTVIADFLGQEFFNAQRVTSPRVPPIHIEGVSLLSVEPTTGSYSANNLAIGLKVNPWAHLLITGNVLIRLNSGGLRSNVVPLVGISYTH